MRETAALLRPSEPASADAALALQWRSLHEQATRVARTAQLSVEPYAGKIASLPLHLTDAAPWRRALMMQGIEDMVAMMQTGLAALTIIERRGGAGHAPALALWREFHEMRDAVLRQVIPDASQSCVADQDELSHS